MKILVTGVAGFIGFHTARRSIDIYNDGAMSRDFIYIEEALGMPAIKNFLPLQSGDVIDTWADTHELQDRVGFRPQVAVPVGVQAFVDWYRDYYAV